MINTKKIIKYIAITLAMIIIVQIFFGILNGANWLSSKLIPAKEKNIQELSLKKAPKKIDINVSSINITIQTAKSFKIQTNSPAVLVKQTKDALYIKEESNNIIKNRNNKDLTIYISKNTILDSIDLKTKAGKITIEKLKAKTINFKLDAGKLDINNITVQEKGKIKGGVGSIVIKEGNLSNINISTGVGKAIIITKLTGENIITAGVGTLELSLLGTEKDYTIKCKKALGNFTIQKDTITSNQTYGEGKTYLELNGGIGSTNLEFIEN